ncbi:hypothetical protein RRG08_053368 [Elysia crispata]|uniref:Uncharacterized protein n=1 Tax=Elysia crispata TaxID=231223 RepID=A0AAE0Z5V3_9GAST|nr:hypothetical protein RRG08_053368 [Elysia crispata]
MGNGVWISNMGNGVWIHNMGNGVWIHNMGNGKEKGTHSASQQENIKPTMLLTWKPLCMAWTKLNNIEVNASKLPSSQTPNQSWRLKLKTSYLT